MILLIPHCKMFPLRSDTSFTSMNNAIIYVTKFYKENFLEFQWPRRYPFHVHDISIQFCNKAFID